MCRVYFHQATMGKSNQKIYLSFMPDFHASPSCQALPKVLDIQEIHHGFQEYGKHQKLYIIYYNLCTIDKS